MSRWLLAFSLFLAAPTWADGARDPQTFGFQGDRKHAVYERGLLAAGILEEGEPLSFCLSEETLIEDKKLLAPFIVACCLALFVACLRIRLRPRRQLPVQETAPPAP